VAKFSIVLPVRNGGEYVKNCVKSILTQTVTDFTLEVLDNCSTDGTLQWLESLTDERIRIYPSDKPLTIEENWGRITTIKKNEFMTFIGHDDLFDSNYLAVMNQLIDKYPDASVYQVHFRYINSKGDKIRSSRPLAETQSEAGFLAFFLCNMSELSIGQVVRSVDYDSINGIPAYPNLLFADLELWIRLIHKSYRATSIDECCSYRIHSHSTTNSSSALKYYHAFMQLLDFFIELKSNDRNYEQVFSKYGLEFFKSYCQTIAHHLLRIPKSKRESITVKNFVALYKKTVDILVPDNGWEPSKKFSIRLAQHIDSNFLTRTLFLIFKKIYSKPILG
jgi:glycosyltransferase involved in cell wall biosynthesis